MKKRIYIVAFLLVAVSLVYAHTPFIFIDDNADGTIFVECGFSNNTSAASCSIYILEDTPYTGSEEKFENKKILFKGKLDKVGCTEIIKPFAKNYIVVFDGGGNHIARAKGPALEESEKSNWTKLLKKNSKKLGKWFDFLSGKK